MAENFDDLVSGLEALSSPGAEGSASNKRAFTPAAWRPKVVYDRTGGTMITPDYNPTDAPGIREFFEDRNMDPDDWMVTNVSMGQWDTPSGEQRESKKISFIPRNPNAYTDTILSEDLDRLIASTAKWKPRAGMQKYKGGHAAYAHVSSDTQIGKKAGRAGTEQTVGRILELTESSIHHYRALQKYGLRFGSVVLPDPGDAIEGSVSQNGRL